MTYGWDDKTLKTWLDYSITPIAKIKIYLKQWTQQTFPHPQPNKKCNSYPIILSTCDLISTDVFFIIYFRII